MEVIFQIYLDDALKCVRKEETMKCLVLAGGKGNSLWPLSREKYPKQFMEIKPNRSLLQETIARNIPFCEEFLIATNKEYSFIVEGQMEKFQGLKYRCFVEEIPRKTAPAIAFACLLGSPSELIFVVSADQMIEGEHYKDAIVRASELAREGYLVTFGAKAWAANTNYGYIRYSGEDVVEFREKPDETTARAYVESGEYCWNSGNFLFRAGDFLNELRRYSPEIYDACRGIMGRANVSGRNIELSAKELRLVDAVSVEHAVFEKSALIKVVESDFNWFDVGDMEDLTAYIREDASNCVIQENCSNVTVVNHAKDRLVVANKLKDMMVVNTEDAIYISPKKDASDVKDIMAKYHQQYSRFFENQTVIYHSWGTYKVLQEADCYKVREVTVYPGKSNALHRHELRSELWSVVKGTAMITLGSETREYHAKDSVYVPVGVDHAITNVSEEEAVIIEISIGEQITDIDKVHIWNQGFREQAATSDIVRLEPAFKDNLWGGTKLKDIYHKKCDYDIVAESWELSAHKDGQSVVADGRFKGMLFGEYLKKIGDEGLGWKCQAFERFPILIKLIDAREPLSIQVHPDDDYALSNENEYGKNELWYIVDCEEGASIYYGVKQDLTQRELIERVRNNTVLEVLNQVEVHRGDTFFVSAGMIHAIGAGVLVCEVQQNSNCTYRLYDFDRRDKFGHRRELHVEKASEVCVLHAMENQADSRQLTTYNGYEIEQLASCKYFVCNKYTVSTEATVEIDEASFCSILFLEGQGTIRVGEKSLEFKAADSFFIPAGRKKAIVTGKCVFVQTHV